MTITQSTVTISDVLYLLGGLTAGTHQDGRLFIAPDTKGNLIRFELQDKRGYATAFRKFGLDLLGWESVGPDYSVWHVFPQSADGKSPSDFWNGIAYASHNAKNVELEELARSISFSLLTASLRMRDICREYAFQNLQATKQHVVPGRRFANIRIFELYMALHSFLAEICSARDYLAQFMAVHFLKAKDVRTMAQLYGSLKKFPPDQTPIQDLVLKMCDESSSDGWLARLSRFRNLIIHSAPINKIAKDRWLTANTIDIQGKEFYQIHLGVPLDPIADPNGSYVDALAHFRQLMLLFFGLARTVGDMSGIQPETVSITDADLR
ncbi:MAG: hypothetical protein WDM86_09165 [Rhizomicrobium sp.]